MIVLYVPFPQDMAGDLTPLVYEWKKNHELNSTQPITIIFYGEDFDLDAIELSEYRLEIYICAHGSDQYPSQLLNHSDSSNAQKLCVETVAERFNSDFLIVSHQIFAIHCYCCGSESKNEALARLFRARLLRCEMPIYSYGGTLFGADSQGKLWSINGNEKSPVKHTAHIIYGDVDGSISEAFFRKPFKMIVMEQFQAECRAKRYHRLFTHRKEKRFEIIQQLREDNDVDVNLPNR